VAYALTSLLVKFQPDNKVSSVFVATAGGSVIKHRLFTPLLDTFPSPLSASSNDFPFLNLLKAKVSKQRFVEETLEGKR